MPAELLWFSGGLCGLWLVGVAVILRAGEWTSEPEGSESYPTCFNSRSRAGWIAGAIIYPIAIPLGLVLLVFLVLLVWVSDLARLTWLAVSSQGVHRPNSRGG